MGIKIRLKKKVTFKTVSPEKSNDVIEETPSKDTSEESAIDNQLAELEKELADIENAKKALHSQSDVSVNVSKKKQTLKRDKPKKAEKKKSQTVKKIDSISLSVDKVHRPWVKEIGNKFSKDFNVAIENNMDRVDITDKGSDGSDWRLCIVGISGEEVDITLFLKGRQDRSQPSICFLNIPDKKTSEIVDDVFDMKNFYQF